MVFVSTREFIIFRTDQAQTIKFTFLIYQEAVSDKMFIASFKDTYNTTSLDVKYTKQIKRKHYVSMSG